MSGPDRWAEPPVTESGERVASAYRADGPEAGGDAWGHHLESLAADEAAADSAADWPTPGQEIEWNEANAYLDQPEAQ